MCARDAALDQDGIFLWLCNPDLVVDPALLASYEELLAPDERARRDRFRAERHRRAFLCTRALVRTALSRHTAIDPAALTFTTSARGKPELAGPSSGGDWRFSVSHTDGLVVCAVASGQDVGVDAECTSRARRDTSVADAFFAPAEIAALRALPPESRQVRFLEYWTLKEAYLKARGVGLAIPLDRIAFTLGKGPPRVTFADSLDDDPAAWQFEAATPTPVHRVAVAVRTAGSAPLPLWWSWITPGAPPQATAAPARRG